MNTKMTGSANEAKAGRTGAIPSTTAITGPMSAVTGSGSASVTQNTMTIARMAARRCAPAGRGIGANSNATKIKGPAIRPTVRRCALNRSSAGE